MLEFGGWRLDGARHPECHDARVRVMTFAAVVVDFVCAEADEVVLVEPDVVAGAELACTRAGELDAAAGAFCRTRPKIETAAATLATTVATLAVVFFFIWSIDLPPFGCRDVDRGMIGHVA